jgi:hypothetical protein
VSGLSAAIGYLLGTLAGYGVGAAAAAARPHAGPAGPAPVVGRARRRRRRRRVRRAPAVARVYAGLRSAEASIALYRHVHRRWAQLPAGDCPRLVISARA